MRVSNKLIECNSELHKRLPTRILNYIIEAETLSTRILGSDSLKGIILFGSHARNGREKASKVSDVDLIIKISDNIPNDKLKRLDGCLDALEIKYGLRVKPDTLFQKFLRVVEKTTGMFVSHFLIKEKDWENCDFPKIFRVNRFFSRMLAPERIVLKSMSQDCVSLAGEGLCSQDAIKITSFDVLKSLAMNLILCLAGNFLSMFVKGSEKYILEAVKWSLRSCYFYLNERNRSIQTIASYFSRLNVDADFLSQFLEYRERLHRMNIGFRFKSLKMIVELHAFGLRLRPKSRLKS